MGSHINEGGEFQSDKYPTCPAGKVPLSTKDPTAQDLLWIYANRREAVDPQFANDLRDALIAKGYSGAAPRALYWCPIHLDVGQHACCESAYRFERL